MLKFFNREAAVQQVASAANAIVETLQAQITIIAGRTGGGKSLCASDLIYASGPRVAGNIRLTPDHPRFKDYVFLTGRMIADELRGTGFWNLTYRDILEEEEVDLTIAQAPGAWRKLRRVRRALEQAKQVELSAADRLKRNRGKGNWRVLRKVRRKLETGRVGIDRLVFENGWDIFVDEADVFMDCTDHSKFGKEARRFLKQHRKRNIRIVFIVQDVSNLWIRIRKLAQSLILCGHDWKMGGPQWAVLPISFSRFWRVEYGSIQPTELNVTRKVGVWYKDALERFNWYDTKQLI